MADMKRFFCDACVVPVRLDAEEPRVDEPVQHHLAHVPLNPAQPLHLFGFQSHPGHLQIFGADALDHVFNFNGSHHDL